MEKLTLKQKAGRANGRSRACEKCKFNRGMFSGRICEACDRAFREGYEKGYKQAKKEMEVKNGVSNYKSI